LVVAGVVLVSALFAFLRGFVRETLAIAGWIGATLGAIWSFPYLRPFADRVTGIGWLGDVITGGGAFLAILVVFWLVTHAIVARVKGSPLNTLDRSLGFLFGAVRGMVIVALAYMAASQAMWREEPPPEWLTQARVLPLVDYSAGLLLAVVPEGTFNLPVEGFRGIQRKQDELRQTKDALDALQREVERLSEPPVLAPANGDKDPKTGYKDSDAKAMDRLIGTLDGESPPQDQNRPKP
jgi:membrane protein required for colicin V production